MYIVCINLQVHFSIELIGNAQYDLKAIFWINRGILPFNSKISYSGAPSLI